MAVCELGLVLISFTIHITCQLSTTMALDKSGFAYCGMAMIWICYFVVRFDSVDESNSLFLSWGLVPFRNYDQVEYLLYVMTFIFIRVLFPFDLNWPSFTTLLNIFSRSLQQFLFQ